MTTRRQWLRLGACLALTGCAKWLGPRTVEISEDDLLQKLAKAFPLRKTVLDVFEVTASAPALRMLPDVDRLAITVPYVARDRLLGSEFKGTLGLSFGLRFEPKDLSLRLVQARVDQFDVGGLPKHATARFGAWLVEDKLKDFPVHRLKPEDLRMADRLGYQVDSIKVVEHGLAVRLVPRPDEAEAASKAASA